MNGANAALATISESIAHVTKSFNHEFEEAGVSSSQEGGGIAGMDAANTPSVLDQATKGGPLTV